jgi:hypothetical protein
VGGIITVVGMVGGIGIVGGKVVGGRCLVTVLLVGHHVGIVVVVGM